MNNRFKELMTALNMTQKDFSNAIGTTQQYISLIMNNKREPSEKILLLIEEKFKVNPKWLRTGNGDMFIEDVDTQLDILCKDYNLDDLDRKLVECYLKLTPQQRESCKSWMKSMFSVFQEDNKAH